MMEPIEAGESALKLECVNKCQLCPNLGKYHAAAIGAPKARVMVVTDHPSTKSEIDTGVILSSEAGDYLTFVSDQADMDREEWYVTALAKCRPHGDGEVTDENISTCMQRWFLREMAAVQPEVVLCMGSRTWSLLSGAPDQAEDGQFTYKHGAYLRRDGRTYIACYYPQTFVELNNIAPFVQIGDLVRDFLGAPS